VASKTVRTLLRFFYDFFSKSKERDFDVFLSGCTRFLEHGNGLNFITLIMYCCGRVVNLSNGCGFAVDATIPQIS